MIHNDTNTARLFPSDTSLLEFGECESAALPDLAVVPNSLGTNSRSEKGGGADAKGGGLSFACCASTKLASWLVEPSANSALPVLSEMITVEDYRSVGGQIVLKCMR